MSEETPHTDDAYPADQFRVLTLDGGGAKGVYTLGLLREFEATLDVPLWKFFNAIYGTSTGSIIASLLSLGHTAAESLELYLKHVPTILKPILPKRRSRALATVADELFGESRFTDFKTFVGIVATNWTLERPLIFKSSVEAAYGMKATFAPGFGCKISEAVQASSSASPFFAKFEIDLGTAGKVEARDGGFAANNPSLFAITDALKAFKKTPSQVRLLSLGVGHYPRPKRSVIMRLLEWCVDRIPSAHLLQKTLSVNANTTEQLVSFLCDSVPHVRVSDRFETPDLATDFLEYRTHKLELLKQKGRDSFGKYETSIKALFT